MKSTSSTPSTIKNWRQGPQLFLRVDRRGHEPAEDEPARQAAHVGGIADVFYRDSQPDVQGQQDE